MNVFKEMALSIYSYESYSKFLKNKKGKIFGFGVLLVTLYFFVSWIIPALFNSVSFFEVADIVDEEVPYFKLQDGTLWVDGVYEEDTGTSYIYINTTKKYNSISDLGEAYDGYDDVVLIDSEKIMQKDGKTWQTTYFSSLGFNFDKYDLINLIPWLGVIVIVFYIIAYFFSVALFFFGVLFVALLGMIIAACMKCRITFGQMYILGIYSRTCPLLLKAIVSFLPFKIPLFWVINFGISLFIIGMALIHVKDEMTSYPTYPTYPQNPVGY